ncbi:hypothetical protein MGYG_07146 [Nannizzia gypsea CBS 118893]|uniref:Uncharacterized protein n=1 Tax=Arthroderma gypseum (strain ATCC MYA-4604 / CBS 118893) TaxID=535722 RepID=E4V274_ARTGP|nr:hypothetical protein MGYG_07146 [Nannizzia gypsea CBS 118893]EFR04139.1 hypothetical protein MGYG_07146 [Nannizzia gypsea CBS 118893]
MRRRSRKKKKKKVDAQWTGSGGGGSVRGRRALLSIDARWCAEVMMLEAQPWRYRGDVSGVRRSEMRHAPGWSGAGNASRKKAKGEQGGGWRT